VAEMLSARVMHALLSKNDRIVPRDTK
jgi:hypothetical protein